MLIALSVVVFGLMLIEARRAWRNERAQLARGGIEPPDDVYKTMRIVYPAAFLAMIAEAQVGGAPPRGAAFPRVAPFSAPQACKGGGVLPPGPFWTLPLIV